MATRKRNRESDEDRLSDRQMEVLRFIPEEGGSSESEIRAMLGRVSEKVSSTSNQTIRSLELRGFVEVRWSRESLEDLAYLTSRGLRARQDLP